MVDGTRLHWAAADDDGWLLRIPELADFCVDGGGRRVVVRPGPTLTDEQLTLLLRGLVLAFVLSVSGECVLHASAVVVDDEGGAVAFAGPSGAGKSTLAAAACASGAPFVTDDVLRVAFGSAVRWVGTAAELRLRPGPAEDAAGGVDRWACRRTPDGRWGLRPPTTPLPDGPLRAVVVPRPSAGGQVVVHRLDPPDAVVTLVGAHRLVHWVDGAMTARQLHHAAAVAATVPVFAVDVPWCSPPPPGIGSLVLAPVLAAVGGG